MLEEKFPWELSKDGDDVEKIGWLDLKDKFPNYEVFWASFIVPMSGRSE